MFPECDEYHLRFQLLETSAHFPLTDDLDLHLLQLLHFTKTVDELETDLDLWLYVLSNGRGMNTEHLPTRLRVSEMIESLEAWAMLTEDRRKREMYEAREKARQAGLAEGRQAGLLIGQIRLCEELLGRQERAEAELAAMSVNGLRQLADQLHAELRRGRKADS